MSPSPDLAGFRDAQARIVAYTGNDITFMFPPSALVYTLGTAIDPQTGRALDPGVQPTSQIDFPSASVRAQVIRSDTAANQAGAEQRAGVIPDGDLWLRVPENTYDPVIFRSTYFEFFGEQYRISRFLFSGMDSVPDHLMIHGVLTNALDEADLAPMPSGSIQIGPYVQENFIATLAQDTFALQYPFTAGTTEVYVDGVRQALGASYDYVESGQAIVFNDTSMMANQLVVVAYQTV